MRSGWVSAFVAATLAGFGALSASCTDPVYDKAIDDLGPETGEANENHRAGQPCVICHSSTGPASSRPFAVAGTVFKTPKEAVGAPGVEILLVDSAGNSPVKPGGEPAVILTNSVGNFWVPTEVWKPTYPIRVNIYCGTQERPKCTPEGTRRRMASQIGREPDCANCHYDAVNRDGKRNPIRALSAVGHIYLEATSSATPAP